MTKYNQPPLSKYKDKRSSSRRRDQKQSPVTEAFAEFVRNITPALKKYLENNIEYQERLAEIEERRTNAEMKSIQAISDFIETIKSEGLKSIPNLEKKKPPKKNDELHKKVIEIIKKKRNAGQTFEEITLYLEKEKIPTFSKRGSWHAQTVHRIYMANISS